MDDYYFIVRNLMIWSESFLSTVFYIQLDMGLALSKLLCARFYKWTVFHQMT